MTRREYLGDLEEIVLLALARCEPEAYGMRIRQEIEDRTGRSVAIGAVYAVVERLADKGLIRAVAAPGGTDRDPRARRFYAITAAGTTALQEAAALRDALWRGLRLARKGQGR